MKAKKMNLTEQFRHARRVSVPLVAVDTPDPGATVTALARAVNANGKTFPVVQWDICRGVTAVNGEIGNNAITSSGVDPAETIGNPPGALELAQKLPRGTIMFYHSAHRFLEDPMVAQGVWNLRDKFKQNCRTLVLLGPNVPVPSSLTHDVMHIDEPFPTDAELGGIVKQLDEVASKCPECKGQKTVAGSDCPTCAGTGQNPKRKTASTKTITKAIEAVRGIAAFPAEQVTAMALRPTGIDLDHLWELKRSQIEQTKGLSVHRGGETFEDVKGLANVKMFIRRMLTGKRSYGGVVWLDEIEKLLSGATGDTQDSSGVSQGILQSLLTHMQDTEVRGVIFLGPAGTGKSLVAKAAGNEAGVPTIAFDSNGMKGGIVGESEQNMRDALKVEHSVTGGSACNKIAALPPELRRRFKYGTFFFDTPSDEEKIPMWDHYHNKHDLTDEHGERPNDKGWTGHEIATCCQIAWEQDITLHEAAKFVIPMSTSAAKSIDALRRQAHGSFIDASKGDAYRYSPEAEEDVMEDHRAVAV
jgi:hypothetical protein